MHPDKIEANLRTLRALFEITPWWRFVKRAILRWAIAKHIKAEARLDAVVRGFRGY